MCEREREMAAVPAAAISAGVIGWGNGAAMKEGLTAAGIGGVTAMIGGADPSVTGIVSMAVGGGFSDIRNGSIPVWVTRGLVSDVMTTSGALPSLIAVGCFEGARKVIPTSASKIGTFLAKSEGADKLSKAVGNISKISKVFLGTTDSLATAASTARGVICLGQGIGTIPKIIREPYMSTKQLRQIYTLTFQCADNVAFTSKLGLIPKSLTSISSRTARQFCLAGYLTDLYTSNNKLASARAALDAISTVRSTSILPESIMDTFPVWIDSVAGLGAVSIAVCYIFTLKFFFMMIIFIHNTHNGTDCLFDETKSSDSLSAVLFCIVAHFMHDDKYFYQLLELISLEDYLPFDGSY